MVHPQRPFRHAIQPPSDTFTPEAAETRNGPGWSAGMTDVHSNDMNGVVTDPGAASDQLVDELIAWLLAPGCPRRGCSPVPTRRSMMC